MTNHTLIEGPSKKIPKRGPAILLTLSSHVMTALPQIT